MQRAPRFGAPFFDQEGAHLNGGDDREVFFPFASLFQLADEVFHRRPVVTHRVFRDPTLMREVVAELFEVGDRGGHYFPSLKRSITSSAK